MEALIDIVATCFAFALMVLGSITLMRWLFGLDTKENRQLKIRAQVEKVKTCMVLHYMVERALENKDTINEATAVDTILTVHDKFADWALEHQELIEEYVKLTSKD